MNQDARQSRRLVVIWSSRDAEVAENLVFMYVANALLRDWWDEVRLVVWGPSAETLAMEPGVRSGLETVRRAGVEVMACRACAENYGVVESLEELGVSVTYMGRPLTEMLQSGWTQLSF
jgi:hypothetical protein